VFSFPNAKRMPGQVHYSAYPLKELLNQGALPLLENFDQVP
jgi:hypothetical protein